MTREPTTIKISFLLLFGIAAFSVPAALHAQTAGDDCAEIAGQEGTQDEIRQIICQPRPRITIPGLQFTSAEEIASRYVVQDPDGSTYVSLPFIGEYLAAVYRWATATAGIIAVLVIIVSGIQWMISGGGEQIASAKKRIAGALIGLVLAVGSYVILYSVNPDLVEFKNLRVKYIAGIPFEFDDGIDPASEAGRREEQGLAPWSGVGHPMDPDGDGVPNRDRMSAFDQCLYDNFFTGLRIGDEIPEETIRDVFGIQGLHAKVNQISAPRWQATFAAVAASQNANVRGFVEWLRDFHEEEIPDFHGHKDGAGDISATVGRLGYRKDGTTALEHFVYSMHSTGLALDFMTRSNWDVYASSRRNAPNDKARPAQSECENIRDELENNEELQNVAERYHFPSMNIPQRLEQCIAENLPWTTIPDEVVQIFEQNGFYWGGRGWDSNPPVDRSDAMHFEYLGPCRQ